MSAVTDPTHLEAAQIAVRNLVERPDEVPSIFLKVTDHKKRACLVALCVTPLIGVACEAAGITPKTLWNWRHAGDPDFLAAFEVARQMGIAVAEDEAWLRATAGTREDVYGSLGNNQGTGIVGERRVKSDTMMIFMLKSAKPDVYRERVEHTGAGGGPIQTVNRIVREVIDPAETKAEDAQGS